MNLLKESNDNNVDRLISIYDDLFDKSDNNVVFKLAGYMLIRDVQVLMDADIVSLYLYNGTHNVFKRIVSSPHTIDNIKMSVFVENVIRSGDALNISTESCYLKDEISTICRQNKLPSIRGILFSPIYADNERGTSKVIGVVEVIKQSDVFSTIDENSLSQLLSKMSGHFTSSPSLVSATTPRSKSRSTLRAETDEMDFYRNKNSETPLRSSVKSPTSNTAMHTYFSDKANRIADDVEINNISNELLSDDKLLSTEAISLTLSNDANDNIGISRLNTIDSISQASHMELIDHSRFGGYSSITEILEYIELNYEASAKNIKITKDTKTLAAAIDNYDFDPFQYSLNELITIAEITIGRYYLTEIFKINPISLRKFIISVAYLYWPHNHFHNFYHASQVLNNCYHVLRNGADKFLTPLDVLLVFVSALCHDLDHPGNNNHFETKKNSWLSKRYSDDAILERHALSISLILVDDDETSIWKEMNNEDRVVFRHLLRTAIISTDMTHHKNLVDEMQISYDVNDVDSRHSLCIHILHCADLSAQTQTSRLAQKWSLLINEEFKDQAEKERLLNLELTDIMQGLDDDLNRSKLQVNFIGNVVLPLWSAFVANFPSLNFAVERIKDNLKYHTENVEIFQMKSISI